MNHTISVVDAKIGKLNKAGPSVTVNIVSQKLKKIKFINNQP